MSVTIKCLPREDFVDGMMFWCPYCEKWHMHGRGDGHRTSHCINKNSPYAKEGYVIKMMTKKELRMVQKGIEYHLSP